MNLPLAVVWVAAQRLFFIALLIMVVFSIIVFLRQASLNPYQIFGAEGVVGRKWLRLFYVGEAAITLMCFYGLIIFGVRVLVH